MELMISETGPDRVRAGYACPCGCTPSVEYGQGAEPVEEGCCCGNEFVVGPGAASHLHSKPGYRSEERAFEAPWGERLQAAWLLGPSVHGPEPGHEDVHAHGDEPHHVSGAIDPVCGMTVDPGTARAMGLTGSWNGVEYYFCGKGCKLDFDEDPERYLDPSYVPSM